MAGSPIAKKAPIGNTDCPISYGLYPLASSRVLLKAKLTYFADLSGPGTVQWIESVTDWAIRITDWGLFPDWVSSHARLADPIRPMPNKGKSGHSGLPIAFISRLPDWVVQSVLPIAIHRLLHRLYPLASTERISQVPGGVSRSDFLWFYRLDPPSTLSAL